MARKTFALCSLLAGLAFCGCGGAPQPDGGAPEDPAAAPPAQAEGSSPSGDPAATTFPARAGLVRIEDEALRVVREYTSQFYEGNLEALHERFSDEFKQSVTLEMLTEKRRDVRDKYGEETEVLGEESQQKGEYRGFMRWARFDKFDGVIEVLWILREDDSIAGFFVRPAERPQS